MISRSAAGLAAVACLAVLAAGCGDGGAAVLAEHPGQANRRPHEIEQRALDERGLPAPRHGRPSARSCDR
jgi:hypothetical protein